MFEKVLAVAIGGAIGASCRFLMVDWVQHRLDTGFPYGTMVVNILGAFIIGFFMIYFMDVEGIPQLVKFLLVTGCLGGFTTFSTFSYELWDLIATTNYMGAFIYGGAHILFGLLACFLGMALGRAVF